MAGQKRHQSPAFLYEYLLGIVRRYDLQITYPVDQDIPGRRDLDLISDLELLDIPEHGDPLPASVRRDHRVRIRFSERHGRLTEQGSSLCHIVVIRTQVYGQVLLDPGDPQDADHILAEAVLCQVKSRRLIRKRVLKTCLSVLIDFSVLGGKFLSQGCQRLRRYSRRIIF